MIFLDFLIFSEVCKAEFNVTAKDLMTELKTMGFKGGKYVPKVGCH